MKLFGLKDENGKEYVLNVTNAYKGNTKDINVYPIEPTPKFKVGDWIISKEHPQDGVVRISEIFGNILYFTGYLSNGNEFHSEIKSQFVRLATSSEIESHLIKVAERRGLLKYGTKLLSALDSEFEYNGGEIGYDYVGDILRSRGMFIYCKGKWATIIPDKKPLPKTKKEFMGFLGTYCNRHCKSVQEFLDEYED